MAKLVITCQTQDKSGVITDLGFNVVSKSTDGKETATPDNKSKATVIAMINKNSYESVTTSKGTKVQVVKDNYLRTDGDQDKTNDLLDCPKCS